VSKTGIEEYIEMYQERLTRLCINLCRNYADAEDLFQETWLKAVNNFDKYDESRDFDKWLFKICINTYKNNCKSLFRHKNINFTTTEEKDIFLSSIPDKEFKNETYTELIEIIKTLPEKYRMVLALRYFNDYSEKDTAEFLNIPVGTVKSRLNKAKQIIKRRLLI